jgi:hypothetical protein
MNTETLPLVDGDGVDVVTLFAPRDLSRDDFEQSVAEWTSPHRAVLVVLQCDIGADALARLASAGADLCVVAPTSTELFTHVERARRNHRLLAVHSCTDPEWERRARTAPP